MSIKRSLLIAAIVHDLSTCGRLAHQRAFRDPSQTVQSRTQLGFLFMLDHRGEQSIKELAEQFSMTSSAVTQVIDELETKGIVARKADTSDGRKLRITLTRAGKTKLATIKKEKLKELSKLLDVLSDDELRQLRRIEQKIVARLTQHIADKNQAKT